MIVNLQSIQSCYHYALDITTIKFQDNHNY